jgi:hypothetical protein
MTTCLHRPAWPPADGPDRDAAKVVSAQPAQGWSLLCNGVVVFDDLGELLPDGRAVAPQGSGRAAAGRRRSRPAPDRARRCCSGAGSTDSRAAVPA